MEEEVRKVRTPPPSIPAYTPALVWHVRAMIKAEHVSGAENGAERAESRVERAWQKTWIGSGRARERTGSGLNRPLTARSNLTFHSTDFITYSPHSALNRPQSTLSVLTLLLFPHLPCHLAHPFTYNPKPSTQLKASLTRPNPSRRHDACGVLISTTVSSANYCKIRVNVNYCQHINTNQTHKCCEIGTKPSQLMQLYYCLVKL